MYFQQINTVDDFTDGRFENIVVRTGLLRCNFDQSEAAAEKQLAYQPAMLSTVMYRGNSAQITISCLICFGRLEDG